MVINSRDLYTYTAKHLFGGVGTLIVSYEIRRYRDVRNLGNKLAYQVLCTQRIIIPNSTPYTPGPQNITAFNNYPAVITSNIVVNNLDTTGAVAPELASYTPRTINSSVSTSLSSGSGTSASASHQHTSGSSVSQSNTFGASASLGFFGEIATGGMSANYSHSWGTSQSTSDSTGTSAGRDRQTSSGEAMSVKDWACYSYLDATCGFPTWIWGQEYPWDIIQFNNANTQNPTSSNPILLPDFVIPLLCNATQALPPSQLSLFGVDFTMKSVWIVDPCSTGNITITHNISYCTASHSFVGGTTNATISAPQPFSFTSPSIDLCVYGLDPIIGADDTAAIIGFVPNKFITQPTPATLSNLSPTHFKIISSGNNLLINDTTAYSHLTNADCGAGFTAAQTGLKASFTPNCAALKIDLIFKINDTSSNYTLFMKHWKTGQSGVMLQIVFNDDTLNPVIKYIDSLEAEGGESNLLSISLRNQNFGSVDYHDFLQLGLNKISLTISPSGAVDVSSGYQIRAVSIERS